MILRWTTRVHEQHYLAGFAEVALLAVDGAYDSLRDGPRNFGARFECDTVCWVDPDRKGIRLGEEPVNPGFVTAHVLTRAGDGALAPHGHLSVLEIDCIWMAVLNDRGDTIDQFVRQVHVDVANAVAPLRG